jgi:hypothetical protein
MKNKFFLAIVALVFSSIIAFGQNAESRFTSTAGDIITSIFLPNPYDGSNYLIGIDEYLNLFVTPFDNTSPFPQQDNANARAFQLIDTYGKIYINGGFFDWDENIVVYGNSHVNNHGVVIKIIMSGGLPVSIKMVVNTYYANSTIIDGCASRRQISNIPTYGNTYDFISKRNGGCLIRYKDDLTANYPARTLNSGYFLSVSWDDDLKKHVVSGNTETSNVIGYFNEAFPSNLATGTFQYLTPSNFGFSERTNWHVPSGNDYYYDTIVYLCQDIRNLNGDGIWLAKINYLTGVNDYFYAYQFPSEKVFIIDAIHNFMNLFILGHHNGFDGYENFEKRYLAQIDLSDPTMFMFKHIDYMDLDTLPWISTYYITQQAFLNNIVFDPVNYNVFTSGSDLDYSYLIETFDLNNDNCNTEIVISMPDIQFSQASYQANAVTSALTYNIGTTATNNTYSSYTLNDDILCDSYGNKSQSKYFSHISSIEQRLEDKTLMSSAIENLGNSHTNSPILTIFDDKYFECENFEGNIVYKIYNIQGQLVFAGKTNNNVQNVLHVNSPGLYIINASDEKNNITSSKFKILK